jgi:hypothetical protein
MIINEIDKVLGNNLSNKTTNFQIEHFIIGNEPNHQSKLHQCLVELQGRRQSLINLDLEINECNDKKGLMEIDKQFVQYRCDEEKQIKDRMFDRKIKHLDNRINELHGIKKSTEDECDLLLKIYKFLVKQEDLRDWNSPEVQQEYWNAKYLGELRVRAMLGKQIDNELMKCIMALPDDTPVKAEFVRALTNQKKNVNISNNDKPN